MRRKERGGEGDEKGRGRDEVRRKERGGRGRRVDGPPHNTKPMREMRREGKGRGEMKGEEI